jgi:hypothetical protein
MKQYDKEKHRRAQSIQPVDTLRQGSFGFCGVL